MYPAATFYPCTGLLLGWLAAGVFNEPKGAKLERLGLLRLRSGVKVEAAESNCPIPAFMQPAYVEPGISTSAPIFATLPSSLGLSHRLCQD